MKRTGNLLTLLAAGALAVAGAGCESEEGATGATPAAVQAPAGGTVGEIMRARGLNEADVTAALKTYMPTGKKDEYYLFASGGHGGNLLVIGVPSMRILKYVGVFTPEPWQGFGFDEATKQILREGSPEGKMLTWADMHHPALSETEGDYDGEYLFVNDKANARIAVINLEDFTTVQIARSGVIRSDHGGTFVTPNTEYVIEGAQYPAPLGGGYAPIEDYQEKYRGAVVLWKFDREKGRIDKSKSFVIELPPYMQDLSDAGKKASDGWLFLNSFNTEMATGGNLEGKPPLESGASQNDMDYLHMINWRKAEQVAASDETTTIKGMTVIPLQTAIDEKLLYFVGEPKSPHGVDVTPDGKEIVVSGKLDTHATVYSWEKIQKLMADETFAGKDSYGVPILPFREAIRGQVEIGLGPLHTQFDGDGNAYTSVFIETTVAKWSLADLKVIEKIPVHYNVGHIATAEGDTVSPDGKYLVAMNKWALDRFADVGPLLPQNFQLIDTSGEKMQLLYDMPIPLGEPHYAQLIRADKINAIEAYRPAGINPVTHQQDPHAVKGGEERIERKADGVHVYMTTIRSHLTPDTVTVKQGDTVHFHITNIEQAHDATHGFAIDNFNVNLSLEPGKHNNVTIQADEAGVFPFYCTEFCSALHLEMAGYLLVEPAGAEGGEAAAADSDAAASAS